MKTALIVIGGLTCLAPVLLFGQETPMVFPFAPATHMNAICLPDDWHKPLVTESGALAYDFGPGPYARPLTEVLIGWETGVGSPVSQSLVDPRIPAPVTVAVHGRDTVRVEVFAIIPPGDSLPTVRPSRDRISRTNGLNGTRWWASPPAGTDPGFRGVAWGTNRSILYKVSVPAGSAHRVAFGLCEPYKQTPRARLLRLSVEGGTSVLADPLGPSGRNTPSVHLIDGRDEDHDGMLGVSVHAAPESPDPNVILNAFWLFPAGTPVTEEEIITGAARTAAEFFWPCGGDREQFSPLTRMDAFIATFASAGDPPALRIRTSRPVTLDPGRGMVRCDGEPFIQTRPGATDLSRRGDTLLLRFPAGTRSIEGVVLHGSPADREAGPIPDLRMERERARRYWRTKAPVPPTRITVPDARLQYLLETSMRNIYQIREVVDGGIQFQPGPTVYRGLWLGDVLISGNIALMTGDTAGVRNALEHLLQFQDTSGQFVVLRPHTSLIETPLYVIAMCRYALYAGDDGWLRSHWRSLQRSVAWMARLNASTLHDPDAPYAGLVPPGFVDGGIAHAAADYGTARWVMIALEHALAAGQRLGLTADQHVWSTQLDRMKKAFIMAAQRDRRHDAAGRRYLPITIGDTTSGMPPQRGQWAFLVPLPYGQFFRTGGPLLHEILTENLAMLDASREQGIIAGSGWLHDGVWPWLAGVHAVGHHTAGNYRRAYEILQAYADHATPLGTWVEEQQPRSRGTRTTGDASNAEASAFFYQAVRSFLVAEHGDTLVFLEGLPEEWIAPGTHTHLTDAGTAFGTVSLSLETTADGRSATLAVSPPSRLGDTQTSIVSLESFTSAGFCATDGTPLPRSLDLPRKGTLLLTMVKGSRPGCR